MLINLRIDTYIYCKCNNNYIYIHSLPLLLRHKSDLVRGPGLGGRLRVNSRSNRGCTIGTQTKSNLKITSQRINYYIILDYSLSLTLVG